MMKVPPTNSDLMTPAETAELLRQTEKTLANQRSRREGFAYVRLPGGGIRYSRKTVMAELEANTVVPQDAA